MKMYQRPPRQETLTIHPPFSLSSTPLRHRHSCYPQGQIKEGVFAFYLGADAPGELVIGGVDHDRYDGELHYTPLKVCMCSIYIDCTVHDMVVIVLGLFDIWEPVVTATSTSDGRTDGRTKQQQRTTNDIIPTHDH